jgi:hypothetical protein
MTVVARRAFGQARARARCAGILGPLPLAAMATASTVDGFPGWRDPDPLDNGASIVGLAYARLVDDYHAMRRAYPEAGAPLTALLQLHELENVKLLWRVAVHGAPSAEWRGAWRPLGSLQSIDADRFAAPLSLPDLVAALAVTPYAEPAAASLRAHGLDLAAAEMAFDRFGSETVVAAHDHLPGTERSARALLLAVVGRRDRAVFNRAVTALGLEPTAAALTTMLGRPPTAQPPADVEALARRIVMLEPFSLGVPLALVLLREKETRGLVTVSELRARHAPRQEARRALEALLARE